jgi:hypothetical protein
MLSYVINDRTRAAVPVIWHGVKRGYELLAALAWCASGVVGSWMFWTLAALPDGKVMQFSKGQTLTELRNLHLACLVFGVLIAVAGVLRIRNWFRPAPGKE